MHHKYRLAHKETAGIFNLSGRDNFDSTFSPQVLSFGIVSDAMYSTLLAWPAELHIPNAVLRTVVELSGLASDIWSPENK